MQTTHVRLRRAGLDDAPLFYAVRKEAERIAHATDGDVVTFESHLAWFSVVAERSWWVGETLVPTLFVGYADVASAFRIPTWRPVGVVRIDGIDPGTISIAVNEADRGRGYGSKMLSYVPAAHRAYLASLGLTERRPALRAVVARTNAVSARLFERAGFVLAAATIDQYEYRLGG